MGQLLQIVARANTKWVKKFITKRVNRYCKMGKVLLSEATLLQSGATITENASTSL